MKKKSLPSKTGMLKYLFVLPLFLLAFCQSEFDEPLADSENKLTKDSKVLSLMKAAIQSDSDQSSEKNKSTLSKSSTVEDDGQCTYFLYPMFFDVYSGDDPDPEIKEINSDEELIAFIDLFTFETSAVASTPNYEMYIRFPITLLDADGVETNLYNLTELEGTLQMAVEACESFNNLSDADSDDGSDTGSDSGSDGGSGDDGSGDDGSGDDGSGDDGSGDDGSGDDGSSDDGSGDDGSGDDGSGDDGSSDDESSDDGSGDDGSGDDGSGDDESDDDGSDDDEYATSSDDDSHNGYQFCDKNSKKVYICHKGITICVSVNAIWGHLQHHEEDYLGTCED